MKKLILSICAMLLCNVAVQAGSVPSAKITLDAYALPAGSVDRTAMANATVNNIAVVLPSQVPTYGQNPNFGARLRVLSDSGQPINADQIHFTFVGYSVLRGTGVGVSEVFILNGSNQPISQNPFGAYNNTSLPNLTARNTADVLTSPSSASNIQTNNSTLTNTHVFFVEGQAFPLGASRRPVVVNLGDRYVIEYHFMGTFTVSGFPTQSFDLTARAVMMVAHGKEQLNLGTDGKTIPLGIDWLTGPFEISGARYLRATSDTAGTYFGFVLETSPSMSQTLTPYASDLVMTDAGGGVTNIAVASGPGQGFFKAWAIR